MLLFLMWAIFLINNGIETNLNQYGIGPREPFGLIGVLTAPLLHGSIQHIFNNSIPAVILIWALFYSYKDIAWKVLLYTWVMGGLLVWMSGSGGYHVGMSGVIYGLSAFLFLSGLLKRIRHLMGLSLLVVFLYGSLIWGVFPVKEGISWEGHLWGAVIGFVLAVFYRKEGEEPKKYLWEYEEEEVPEGETPYWMQGSSLENQPQNVGSKNPNKDAEPKTIQYIYVEKKKEE